MLKNHIKILFRYTLVVKKRAVSALNQNITQVYEILQCMSNDESLSADTMEGAKCLLCLFNFKIFILLDI